MFNLTSSIIAYESGELEEDGIVELFQYLVDTGLAWSLQGSYGRYARWLIERGSISAGGTRSARAKTGARSSFIEV